MNRVSETPELGKAIPSPNPKYKGKALYVIKEKASPGITYTLVCPKCHNAFLSKAGTSGDELNKARCEICQAVICYKTKCNNVPITDIEREYGTESLGVLSWKGESPVTLRLGDYLIGQEDADKPSDIAIKDTTVSRQSALLSVLRDASTGNYRFRFTLLRTTNPAFINSNKLYEGDSIYLNFDDTIKLGRTTITFKRKKLS